MAWVWNGSECVWDPHVTYPVLHRLSNYWDQADVATRDDTEERPEYKPELTDDTPAEETSDNEEATEEPAKEAEPDEDTTAHSPGEDVWYGRFPEEDSEDMCDWQLCRATAGCGGIYDRYGTWICSECGRNCHPDHDDLYKDYELRYGEVSNQVRGFGSNDVMNGV